MNKVIVALITVVVIVGVGYWVFRAEPVSAPEEPVVVIGSFEECIAAGNPAMESYPRQCMTVDGKSFTEEACRSSEGGILTLAHARTIALEGVCGSGDFKETYMCNDSTGTWWLDMNIEKEGCSPACVVNVDTREAEINWRCTGLILPEDEELIPEEAGLPTP